MITAPALGAAPVWVSIEGINGVGKTSVARALAAQLGDRCLLLDELTDSGGTVLHGQVIAALTEHGDPFLRTGHPVAETLALLALQVGKAERLAGRDLTGVEVILEDRGMDSVAVYQAAILRSEHPDSTPDALANHFLSGFRRWRRLSDVTILLTGDPEECARRFAARIGRPLTPEDLHLLNEIDTLYRRAANDDPERYVHLDVAGMSQEDTAGAVGEIVATLMDRQATHVS
jgi:dTMP kinase